MQFRFASKVKLSWSLKEAQQESHKISSHKIYLENWPPVTDTLKILIWVRKNLWEICSKFGAARKQWGVLLEQHISLPGGFVDLQRR